MTKEAKLIDAIVDLADQQLGGDRSGTAKALFYDIADECEQLGFSRIERIMRRVAEHYDYD